MKDELTKKYKEIIFKTCKQKEIRQMCLDFFDDFCKQYGDHKFVKSDFETITVDGQTIEQDVVKDLFVGRTEVPAPEIVVYQMQHHLNSIKLREFHGKNLQNIGGYYQNDKKKLRVQKPVYERQKISASKIMRPFGLSDDEWKKEEKRLKKEQKKVNKESNEQYKKEIEKDSKDFIKHNLYHELCHVLEVKSFADRKYIRTGLTTDLFTYRKFFGYLNKFDEKHLTEIKIKKSHEDFEQAVIHNGELAISEILNETYAASLLGPIELEQGIKNSGRDGNVTQKCGVNSRCAYYENYDISLFLKYMTSENFEQTSTNYLRYNYDTVNKKIEELNIDPELLAEAREQIGKFVYERCDYYKFNPNMTEEEIEKHKAQDREAHAKLLDNLKDKSSFENICVIMGIYNATSNFSLDKYEKINEYKAIIQSVMLNGVKNKLVSDLNDPNKVKDVQFFQNVDQMLKSIDKVLCYPNGKTNYAERLGFRGKEIIENSVFDVNVLSVDKFSQKYPDKAQIKEFKEMIDIVKSAVKGNKELEKTITFLAEQKEIDESYEKLMEKDKNVREEYEKKLKEKEIQSSLSEKRAKNFDKNKDDNAKVKDEEEASEWF